MATEILKIVDKNDSFIVHVVKSDFVSSDNIVRFAVESMDDKNCLRLGQMLLDNAFVVMDDDGDNPTSKVKVTITYEPIAELKKLQKKLPKNLANSNKVSIFAT